MRVLDLFCGMGGWSIGFYREGFACTGVDISDVGYPYELIKMDIRKFHTLPHLEEFDVIVASPPCTDSGQGRTIREEVDNGVAFDPLVSWKRAKIPLALSIPIAKACRKALDNTE